MTRRFDFVDYSFSRQSYGDYGNATTASGSGSESLSDDRTTYAAGTSRVRPQNSECHAIYNGLHKEQNATQLYGILESKQLDIEHNQLTLCGTLVRSVPAARSSLRHG